MPGIGVQAQDRAHLSDIPLMTSQSGHLKVRYTPSPGLFNGRMARINEMPEFDR
jgi:hypothetical protein